MTRDDIVLDFLKNIVNKAHELIDDVNEMVEMMETMRGDEDYVLPTIQSEYSD